MGGGAVLRTEGLGAGRSHQREGCCGPPTQRRSLGAAGRAACWTRPLVPPPWSGNRSPQGHQVVLISDQPAGRLETCQHLAMAHVGLE